MQANKHFHRPRPIDNTALALALLNVFNPFVMGAESGGGTGDASPSQEISEGRPPRNKDISATFS